MKLTPNKHVVKFLKNINKQWQQMPYWKRGILEISSKSNNTKSRKENIIE